MTKDQTNTDYKLGHALSLIKDVKGSIIEQRAAIEPWLLELSRKEGGEVSRMAHIFPSPDPQQRACFPLSF